MIRIARSTTKRRPQQQRPTRDDRYRLWNPTDWIDAQFTGAMPEGLSRKLQTKRAMKGRTI